MGFESPLFLRCFVAKHELVDLAEHLIGILERVGWPRSTWSHHAGMQYLSDEVNYAVSYTHLTLPTKRIV